MVRRLAVLVAALLLLAATSLASAQAATVVFYSKTSGSYGWCAGSRYGYASGETCANQSCAQYGGTDCTLAVECAGGWAATAFAEPPASGFGTSCGWNGALGARAWALIDCMLASNTFCHLDQTFDRNGNQRSDRDNQAFDQVWLTQVLLDLNGNNAGSYDGELGPKTSAGVRAFQLKVGLAQTGLIDDTLLAMLRDGMGGPGALLNLMKTDPNYVGKIPADTFSFSSAPRPDRTLGEELALLTEAARRQTLGIMLDATSTPCSLPARNVAVEAHSEFAKWDVECAEGSYRISVNGPGKWSVYDLTPVGDAAQRRVTGAGSHDDNQRGPDLPSASGQGQ